MKHFVILNNPYSASDVDLTNRKLKITGATEIDYLKLTAGKIQAKVNETVKVGTATISLAANTRYEFSFSQNIDGRIITGSIFFTSGGAVPTTQVTAGLRDMFNNSSFDGNKFKATAVATSNTVLTITAAAGFPLFTMTNIVDTVIATTTPGVEAIGTLAKVSATVANQTSVVGSATAAAYTTVTLTYSTAEIPLMGTKRDSGDNTLVVFLDESDADLAATVTKITNILDADDGAGVANSEAIAVA